MSEAWWCPAITIPGETIDGVQMNRLILTERARPDSLLVDATGRRFVNEAQNYNDLGRTLQNFHPGAYTFPHVPAWLIFDAAYRASYRLGPLGRRDPDPEWLAKGDTLAELAGKIGLPADALEATVARFNEGARRGEDPDFGRGSYPYDRFIGGIGPLEEGPYYALRVRARLPGTKGGPRTDGDGRVRSIERRRHRRPVRGRQRLRERVRHGLPRRRRDARPGARVRLAGRRRGGGGLMLSACWTLPDHVDRAAERWPDTEALVWPDERLTFAEFAARTRAFAHALLERGVRPGDKVGILMPNTPGMLVAIYGTTRLGAVPVPINGRFKEREVAYVSEHAEIRLLVTGRNCPPTATTRSGPAERIAVATRRC